jgi:hypothetical protein
MLVFGIVVQGEVDNLFIVRALLAWVLNHTQMTRSATLRGRRY